MKKVVRMLGLCALVALAFTSCKKNNETNSVTFKASMVQPTADSRTIGVGSEEAGYWAIWSDNDKIMVVNPAGDDNKDFTLTTRSGQNAVFTVTDPDKVNFLKDLETDTYTAFYPFAELNGNEVTIPINPNQTADELGCTFGINLSFEPQIEVVRYEDVQKVAKVKENYQIVNRSRDLAYIIYTSGTTGIPK